MKNKLGIVFGAFLLLVWALMYNKNRNNILALVDDYSVTLGSIQQLGFNGGGTVVSPSFKFYIDGKLYKGTYSFNLYCRKFSRRKLAPILGKKVPIVYNPKNPNVNLILLKKDDFERFNVDYSSEYRLLLEKYFDCDQINMNKKFLKLKFQDTLIVK